MAAEPGRRLRIPSWLAAFTPWLVLVGLISIVMVPGLSSGKFLLYGDLCAYSLPLLNIIRESWAHGEPPLWIPQFFGGYPLLAEGQNGPLYPVTLLSIFLPPLYALTFLIMFHLGLAGGGTYAYLRAIGLMRTPAMFGGAVFMLSVPILGRTYLFPLLATVAWIPVLFFVAERASHGSRLWVPVCGSVLALQLVAGQPQGVFLGLLAWPVYFALRSRQHQVTAASILARLTVVFLIGFGLAAPQLLARLELLQESVRVEGTFNSLGFSLPPRQLLTVIIPSIFGAGAPEGRLGYWGAWSFWDTGIFVGVVPIVLAATTVSFPAWTVTRAFHALCSLFSCVLAFGSYCPVSAFILTTPPFAYFRAPGRFLILTAFGVSVLAALGLDAMLTQPNRHQARRRLVFIVIGMMIFLGTASSHVLLSTHSEYVLNIGRAYYRTHPALGGFLDPATIEREVRRIYDILLGSTDPWTIRGLGLPIALVMFGTFFTDARSAGTRKAIAAGLVVVAISDLVSFAGDYLVWSDDPQVDNGRVVHAIATGAGAPRVFSTVNGYGSNCRRTVASLAGATPALHNVGFLGPISPPLELQIHAAASKILTPSVGVVRPSLLQAWGVGYLITERELRDDHLILKADLRQTEANVLLYRVRDPAPRVAVVPRFRVGSLEAATVHAGSIDARQMVLLAKAPSEHSVVDGDGTATATIIKDDPRELRIRLETDSPGWLVVNDTYYPGWHVTVDDHDREIYLANGFVRAIRVYVGDRMVVMTYSPAWLVPGLVLSMVAFATVVGMVGCAWLSLRKTPDDHQISRESLTAIDV